jgi:hypothetical protein
MYPMLMAITMAVFFPALIGSARAEQLDPSLAGWWRFDDGAGSTAVDSSGHERHGVLIGNPQWVAGIHKGALAFDGGGNHVAVPGYEGVLGAHARTCAAWIKVAKTAASIITWGPSGTGTKWTIRTHGGPASLRVECGQGSIYGTIDLANGEWHHVAVVLADDGSPNADEIKLYVDGVLDKTGGVTPRAVNTSTGGDLQIGYDLNNTGRTFQGSMDDVRVYTRALSGQEIANLMQDSVGFPTQAVSPEPRDGALLNGTWTTLTWTAGDLATSHDVYLATSFADVNEATPQSPGIYIGNQKDASLLIGMAARPYPGGLVANTTYYWRVDEVSKQAVVKGKVWSFTVPPTGTWKPLPVDGARLADPNSDLTWTPGLKAVMFAVHFGDDLDKVTAATVTVNMTLQTIFDPGPLEPGKTYYWRVDEFDGTAWKTGDVWRFTVAPLGGGIKGEYFNNMELTGVPVLTRIDPGIDFMLGAGSPEPNVVNVDAFSVRWRGEIEAAFSEVYTLYTRTDDGSRLWVDDRLIVDKWTWVNRVVDTRGEPIALVAGQRYSIQMEWYNQDENAEAHLLWESASQPKGMVPAAALTPPFKAGAPAPGRNAADVRHTPSLMWSAGDYAAEHDVYFGDSQEAVANATPASTGIYQGRQRWESTTFDPDTLEWNKTYYWRIDEVNEAHADSPWKGPVWSFTTANFIVVDDFESYTDDLDAKTTIFDTWIDGWTNNTGSVVGHLQAPFAERTIVHGGRQAMPLSYNNAATPYYSQAELTWPTPQDWTVHGVDTLTLSYQGDAANSEATLYVMLEDKSGRSGMSLTPNTAALLTTTWQQWDIPLSTFSAAGVDLRAVKTLYLGVGNPKTPVPDGTGQMYIDDIRVIKR